MKLRQLKSTMIIQVHDELVFNVVAGELPVVQELAVRLMEEAFRGSVPLEVQPVWEPTGLKPIS